METKFQKGFDQNSPAQQLNWSLNSQPGDDNYHLALRYSTYLETMLPNTPFEIQTYIYQAWDEGMDVMEIVKVIPKSQISGKDLQRLQDNLEDLDPDEYHAHYLREEWGKLIFITHMQF